MLSLDEVCNRLGKSYAVVYQAVRKGSVPAIRGPRRGSKPSVLIPESFLPVWASRGKVPRTSPSTLAALNDCWLKAQELNRPGI